MQTPHLDAQYEAEIQSIRTRLARTGARCEQMVRDAVKALLERDPALARQVMAVDRELDRLEVELDHECVILLARRSPVGEDLRLVTTALKADVDMERIGDLAVHVAERAIELASTAGLEPLPEILQLARGALSNLSLAMRSLAEKDGVAARQVLLADRQLDTLHGNHLRRLIQLAKDHPDQLERMLAWSSVSRHFERISDHACNIAEMVVFLAEGRMLRHGGPKAP
jgi:phosphate transport system protein